MFRGHSLRRRVAACLATLLCAGGSLLATGLRAHAATTAFVNPVVDGGFEQGPAQSAWTETQSSGSELIDQLNPRSGSWAADLCNIDNCRSSTGGPGDAVIQTVTAPGQVVSASLSYGYSVATAQPDRNAQCQDWLMVAMGVNGVPDPAAAQKYCQPTNQQYVQGALDVTSFLQAHPGAPVQVQFLGFTDNLYPSQFFVDDVALNITYLTTPSAPVGVSGVTDCSTGSTTLSWSPPLFPSGNQYPVQLYTITPYTLSGVAQPSTTVPGNQTSLNVSLNSGSTCYFTVTASNSNGVGAIGAPALPVAAVSPLAATQSNTGFALAWHTQAGSAAAAAYRVMVRDGNGAWLPWSTTPATWSMVYGFPGHAYSYYVEALNGAGQGIPPPGNGGQAATAVAANAMGFGFTSMYGVDAYGNLQPAGSPPLASTASWPGWAIVRGIASDADGQGGQVLDGWGGVHSFGNAPTYRSSAYWPNWDIARGVAIQRNGSSGYVADAYGAVHPFGSAAPVSGTAYWNGWDIVRGLALRADGSSGYTLDGWGGLHPFGGAPNLSGGPYWNGWDIARSVALLRDGQSGYVLDGWGNLHPFGTAVSVSNNASWPGWDIARGVVITANGSGYTVDGYGGVHPFGQAPSVFAPNYNGTDVMRGLTLS